MISRPRTRSTPDPALRTFGRLEFLVTLGSQLRLGLCHHRLALAIGDQRPPPGDPARLVAVANEIGARGHHEEGLTE